MWSNLTGSISRGKTLILDILSRRFPLSAREVHSQIKKQHSQTITYQAVHKFLGELEKESIVLKKDREYMLNINWISDFQRHLQNVRHSYQGEGDLLHLDFDNERTPLAIIAKYKESLSSSLSNTELLEIPTISKLYLTTLDHRSSHPKKYSLLQELKKQSHALILGSIGSGKTVLSKYLAYIYANKSNLIPILINLQYDSFKDVTKSILRQLYEHIDTELDEEFVEPLLKEGNFVFLIDSLDSRLDKTEFIISLRRLISQYKRNHWYVFCRFDSDPKQALPLLTYQINSFSRRQVFSILFKMADDSLYRRVKQDKNLFTLCKNPQFLTFAIEAFKDDNPIVHTAADLYKSYLTAILHRHSHKTAQCRLLVKPVLKILSELAYQIKAKQEQLDWEFIVEIVEKHSTGNKEILYSFLTETGLLKELAHSKYEFNHAPLIEYLAAYYIQEQYEKNPPSSILHKLIYNSNWLEVFCLYSTLEPDNVVLDSLWKRYQENESIQDLLLLGKILSSAGLLGETRYQDVLRSLLSLYSLPDSKFYPQWYKLHSIFSNIHSKQEHRQILHFLEALRDNPNARLTNVLFNSTVSIDNDRAYSLLSDAMKKTTDPHFIYSLAEIVGIQKASSYLGMLFSELLKSDPISKAVIIWAIEQCDDGLEKLSSWNSELNLDNMKKTLFVQIEMHLRKSNNPIQIGHSCIELCRLDYARGLSCVYEYLDRVTELSPVLKYHLCYALSLDETEAEYDIFETFWQDDLRRTQQFIVDIQKEVQANV